MPGVLVPTQLPVFPISMGKAPEKGPKAIICNVDFTTAGGAGLSQVIDLEIPTENDRIEFVQGVWLDNSQNSGITLSLLVNMTGQLITIPGGWQGWFCLAAPDKSKFIVTASAATSSNNTPVIFVNMPVAGVLWNS